MRLLTSLGQRSCRLIVLLLEQIAVDFVAAHPKTQLDKLLQQLQEFSCKERQLQEERGINYDLVNAVLGENDPEYSERALKDLDVRDRALFLQTTK